MVISTAVSRIVPFPQLPPKLRNKTYAFAFDSGLARVYHSDRISLMIDDALALLASCRQTRHEVKTFGDTSITIRFSIQGVSNVTSLWTMSSVSTWPYAALQHPAERC